MTEKLNDFRVISVFKVIIRVCKQMFDFCGKPSKFLTKSCLFIFCIFCFMNYIENDFSYFTSQKKNKRGKNIIQ